MLTQSRKIELDSALQATKSRFSILTFCRCLFACVVNCIGGSQRARWTAGSRNPESWVIRILTNTLTDCIRNFPTNSPEIAHEKLGTQRRGECISRISSLYLNMRKKHLHHSKATTTTTNIQPSSAYSSRLISNNNNIQPSPIYLSRLILIPTKHTHQPN